MTRQNEKQPKAKTGLARCLELASGHKWLLFLSGFLAALAAICSFAPYLSIYHIIREILFVYPDMSLLNVSAISTWGWLALAGIWRQFLCNRNFLGDTFVFILQILWKRERKKYHVRQQ